MEKHGKDLVNIDKNCNSTDHTPKNIKSLESIRSIPNDGDIN